MITVLSPGFYSTIQDVGRFGGVHYGVPVSGAMDMLAYKEANSLVGNSTNEAVLEMTMTGAVLRFNEYTVISVCGATVNPKLNGEHVGVYRPINIKKNDILEIGRVQSGFRTYLAVSGGFDTEFKFNSRSWYEGITKNFRLAKSDQLTIFPKKESYQHTTHREQNLDYLTSNEIVVYKGPEYELLSNENKAELSGKDFTISKYNNRMAYQFEEMIKNRLAPIITAPVIPGTVQLTPSGRIIILMRDCQTTGGYPRILQLNEEAQSTLSQKYVGNKLRFKLQEYE